MDDIKEFEDKTSMQTVRGIINAVVRAVNALNRLITDKLNIADVSVYNVTVKHPLTAGTYYTLATAIPVIPVAIKKKGLKITFETADGVWEDYQFKGAMADWSVASNWANLSLSLKQNATENSLDTDSKNIVGAINENNEITNISALPHGKSIEVLSGNLLNSITLTDGYIINYTDGKTFTHSSFSCSDYIDISNIKYLMSSHQYRYSGAFYGVNKNYIKGIGSEPLDITQYNKIWKVPTNAKYIRINIEIINQNKNTTFLVNLESDIKVKFPWLFNENKIDNISITPNKLYTSSNLITNIENWVVGKYLNGSGVAITNSAVQYSNDYIPIPDGVTQFQQSSVMPYSGVFYDIAKNVIGYWGASSGTNVIIDIPQGTKYVRANFQIAEITNNTAYLRFLDYNKEYYIDWLKLHDYQIKNALSSKAITPNKIYPSYKIPYNLDDFVDNAYLDGNGIERTITGTTYSKNYIEVPIGVTQFQQNLTSIYGGVFYDECKNVIGYWGFPAPTQYNQIFDIPQRVKYIRANFGITNIANGTAYLKFLNYNEDTDYYFDWLKVKTSQLVIDTPLGGMTNQWKGKTICWLGTSIPYGYATETGAKNYPTLISERLECTVVNTALPGQALHTTAQGGVVGSGSSSLSVAEYNALGITDVGNKSYENCLLGKNADLYVFDCEPNNTNFDLADWNLFDFYNWKYTDDSTFESHRTTYLGALIFMLDKLYTEKPLARVVFVGEYGYLGASTFGTEYKIRTNTLLAADKMNIPYINVFDKLQYNKFNISSLIPDEVHPQAAGHQKIADILTNELLLIS